MVLKAALEHPPLPQPQTPESFSRCRKHKYTLQWSTVGFVFSLVSPIKAYPLKHVVTDMSPKCTCGVLRFEDNAVLLPCHNSHEPLSPLASK